MLGSFRGSALIFDRSGEIVGKYRKTHAAIDHYEGSPPWKHPRSGQTRDWMLRYDPEWIMEAGEELPRGLRSANVTGFGCGDRVSGGLSTVSYRLTADSEPTMTTASRAPDNATWPDTCEVQLTMRCVEP